MTKLRRPVKSCPSCIFVPRIAVVWLLITTVSLPDQDGLLWCSTDEWLRSQPTAMQTLRMELSWWLFLLTKWSLVSGSPSTLTPSTQSHTGRQATIIMEQLHLLCRHRYHGKPCRVCQLVCCFSSHSINRMLTQPDDWLISTWYYLEHSTLDYKRDCPS